MNNSEFAQKVIEVLETSGWTQGQYHNLRGYCLAGACYKVAGEDFATDIATDIEESLDFTRFYEALYNKLHTSPIGWNDSDDREYAQVIDLLKSFVHA